MKINGNGASAQRMDSNSTSDKVTVKSVAQRAIQIDSLKTPADVGYIEALTEQVKAAPDIRVEAVEKIKKSIDERTRNVTSEQVAEKIISGRS